MSTVVVVGAQWGDEGKGKIIDMLSNYADVIVRFQGGANAGHTIVVGDKKVVLHLLPSGVLHEKKYCVIGNGVVLDPEVFEKEIEELKGIGYLKDDKRLLLSSLTHIIMPYHKRLDALKEDKGKKKIGTTGRGIGPAYEDKVSRLGIRVVDLLDKKVFADKVRQNLELKNFIIRKYYKDEPFKARDIINAYGVVRLDGDYDAVAATGHGFIDGVICDFVYKMMKTALVCAADVHTGTAAHRLPSAQYLDLFGRVLRTGVIFNIGSCFFYH